MNHDPIAGVKADSFNGIQFYKEILGIDTRVNPKKLEDLNIHKEKID
jgi:hypothetical protein